MLASTVLARAARAAAPGGSLAPLLLLRVAVGLMIVLMVAVVLLVVLLVAVVPFQGSRMQLLARQPIWRLPGRRLDLGRGVLALAALVPLTVTMLLRPWLLQLLLPTPFLQLAARQSLRTRVVILLLMPLWQLRRLLQPLLLHRRPLVLLHHIGHERQKPLHPDLVHLLQLRRRHQRLRRQRGAAQRRSA